MPSTTFPNQIMRASAGTGKTFQLSNRYLGLLAQGADCPSILATTFTRKAAGEILDRIVLRLSQAALDERAANELGQFIGVTNLSAESCRRNLAGALHQLHRLQIGTLDSFFSRLARSFSLELGLFGDWQVINNTDYEYQVLRDEAIERLLELGKATELMHLLTKGEANRGISSLIRDSVTNLYAIFLDSSAEAWHKIPREKLMSTEEIQDIVDQLRDHAYPQPKMQETVESDIAKFLGEEYQRFLETGVSAKIAAGETVFNRKEIPAEVLRLMSQLVNEAAKIMLNQIALQTEANYKVLELYHEVFNDLKAERGVLQYDDIARGLAAFVAEAAHGTLYYRLDRRISHLLLDEFQDTSPIQWNVLRPFARLVTDPSADKNGDKLVRSFFCVGDTKQAIYRWRGGEAKIFDTVGEQLDNVEEATPLTQSFRSSPVVIDAINEIFSKLPRHPNLDRFEQPVEQWCSRYLPHSTQKNSLPGHVTLEIATDKENLLEYAADRIAELVSKIPDKTIGVLVRTNVTVSNLIALLGKRGVLASEEGGNPLVDSAAVRVVLSALTLADHPSNRVAWFHLQNSPLAKLFRFVTAAGKPIAYDSTKIETLAAEIRARLLADGYGPVIESWAELIRPICSARERDRLRQCVDLAYNNQQQTTLRPTDFVKYIESAKVSDPSAARVRVMNVHQAKGLEFDIVVLPQVDQQLITQTPTWVYLRRSPAEPIETVCRYINQTFQKLIPESLREVFRDSETQDINDVLCWMYVALTRARQALHVIIEPSDKERQLPRTVAGLIRAALAIEEPINQPRIIFESGDPQWYLAKPDAAPQPPTKVPPFCLKRTSWVDQDQKIKLAKSLDQKTRGLETSSPSSLEGGSHVTISELFKTAANVGALQRGTIIHRWFEQIEWLDDAQTASRLEDQRLFDLANEILELQIPIAETIKQFRAMLRQPGLRSLLEHDYYADLTKPGFDVELAKRFAKSPLALQVFNERQFAIRSADGILQGSIDRLVLILNGDQVVAADIVDFKTDTIDPNDPASIAAKREFYQPQLQAYSEAVSQLYDLPLARVRARVAFVQSGVVIDVSCV